MEGLSLLHKYQEISNLDKSGQIMCVMSSRHSCGEDGRWKMEGMTQPKWMALTQMGSAVSPHFFIKYL